MGRTRWVGLAITIAVVAGCAVADAYRADGWGSTSREVPGPICPILRPDWDQVKEDAAAIIEQALPTATDVGPVSADELGGSPFGTESFQWVPGGRTTLLPPGGHGQRIHQVEVFMTPTTEGQAVTFDDEFGPTFRFNLSTEVSGRLFEVLLPPD